MKPMLVRLALLCSIVFGASSRATEPGTTPEEWRSTVNALAPIGDRMSALMSDPGDAQLRKELYQMLYSGVSAAYLALLQADKQYPDFWPVFNEAYNFWAPNPDNVYYSTPIEGDGVYRISGFRGTVRIVDFQIAGGTMLPYGKDPLGPTYANYDLDRDVHLGKPDRSFDVVLSKERPASYTGDWWKLDPNATYILVRQISYDWLNEQDGRFAIERLDRPVIKPRLTEQEIDARLQQIAVFAENWTKVGLQWLKNLRTKGVINRVIVHDLNSQGGLSTQKYIEGLFELAPDEALIYETEVPKRCRFWNLELTDELWRLIDTMNRQSSLNGYTAKRDKDGKFRAVIAATDPGVANWLDTAGYRRGALFGRWTECDSYPQPEIRKVKLAKVRNYLPADTATVTAAERNETIRLRRKGAQLRRRW